MGSKRSVTRPVQASFHAISRRTLGQMGKPSNKGVKSHPCSGTFAGLMTAEGCCIGVGAATARPVTDGYDTDRKAF
jgi:hypothetical protein